MKSVVKHDEGDSKPKVAGVATGAVVIGRNEGARLRDCLSSIGRNYGVVFYVDSGSSDDSCEIAEKYGAYVVRLNPDRPFTAARARNAGAAALKVRAPEVSFVQFVDGDCSVDPGWLGQATQFLIRRKNVAVVCGRRRERYPEASIYNAICDLEWNTPIGEATECGGDSLMRLQAFDSVNGFNDSIVAGEEVELCMRLRRRGWKIWRLDAPMTVHDAAMTRFRQWWARTVRGGYGEAEIAKLSGRSISRRVASALFWTIALPILICAAAMLNWLTLLMFLTYPLQLIRIAWAKKPFSLKYAAFMMISKPAMSVGVFKYWTKLLTGSTVELAEYKKL